LAGTEGLDRDAFLAVAKALGLDWKNPRHMEELYVSVQNIVAGVNRLRQIELGEVEPALVYRHPESRGNG
jgi:hypothetical protein